MKYLKYKKYIGDIEYSEEDNCFFGKVLGMKKVPISYKGNTAQELKENFINGIEQYLEDCKEKNIQPQKSFTGSFNIRIPAEVHGKVALIAESEGISLNAFIRSAIEEKVESYSKSNPDKV